MKQLSLILVTVACATASAGKRERDALNQDAIPAARAAEANIKAACDCELSIVYDASIESADEIYFAKSIADDVSHGAAYYCTDAASRKAVCHMKKLEIAASPQIDATFDGGTVLATTNGRGAPTWNEITRLLDR